MKEKNRLLTAAILSVRFGDAIVDEHSAQREVGRPQEAEDVDGDVVEELQFDSIASQRQFGELRVVHELYAHSRAQRAGDFAEVTARELKASEKINEKRRELTANRTNRADRSHSASASGRTAKRANCHRHSGFRSGRRRPSRHAKATVAPCIPFRLIELLLLEEST